MMDAIIIAGFNSAAFTAGLVCGLIICSEKGEGGRVFVRLPLWAFDDDRWRPGRYSCGSMFQLAMFQ